MAAYVIITREKTRDAGELDEYRQEAAASFQQHAVTFRARHGRHEVVEGAATESVLILEFATYEEAQAWYRSAGYQSACKHRFLGGDYRIIITEGVPAT